MRERWLRFDGGHGGGALFPIACNFVRIGQELFEDAADFAVEAFAFEQLVGLAGGGGLGREAIFGAIALQEPGGGLPAFAVGDFVDGVEPRLDAGGSDLLGKIRISASGVEHAATGNAYEPGGFGHTAAKPQQVAILMAPRLVEDNRPPTPGGRRRWRVGGVGVGVDG